MQQEVKVSFAQLAQVGLAIADKATIQADENSLALAQGFREMLRGIVSGALVVTVPSKPEG